MKLFVVVVGVGVVVAVVVVAVVIVLVSEFQCKLFSCLTRRLAQI